MSRALVTGGCGFIGSNLVHKLASMGWEIDVVDDLSSGLIENLEGTNKRIITADTLHLYANSFEVTDERDVLIICGDFAHETVLGRISSNNYDYVFHLAANPRVEFSVKYPQVTTEINVLKTVELFKACADANVKRVVFASSSAVYGEPVELPTSEVDATAPESPYGLQKLQGEQYATLFAKLYGLDVISLRFFNVYGPRQLGDSPYSTAVSSWCNAIYNDESLRSDGDGTQSRDMVYVDDVVQANICAASVSSDFAGSVYNIGSGDSITNNEIIEKLRASFEDLQVTQAPAREGDVMHTLADVSSARSDLGFEPNFTFDKGLDATLTWWDDRFPDEDFDDNSDDWDLDSEDD